MDRTEEDDNLPHRLLDGCQRDFPLTPRPFGALAARLGTTEARVLDAFRDMRKEGLVGRIGAVYRTNTVGSSCLAAIGVPLERLDEVAALVCSFPEVNHNYEREHAFNLWFVVTAPDQARRDAVLDAIETESGLRVLRLPMLEDFHLDLGFKLSWS
ncbi:MAG: Lrp/AsnC family transcriptional regulator [Alphaproteobacteria bacterium]|nr:Lrp/AsnC family transcriptional regulator [Alphaproteobacteria bacterium]